MKNQKDNEFRKRSGSINNRDPLVSFLYTLMRDYVVPSDIETIMDDHIPKPDIRDVEFSNGWLANYAEDIAKRLQEEI